MIEVKWLNSFPMQDLKRINLATRKLKPKQIEYSPEEFRNLLKGDGHSTLRWLSIEIFDDDIDYNVGIHLRTHTKEHTQCQLSSGRPDLTGKERDYSEPRWFMCKTTPMGLIKLMEQRLCCTAEEKTKIWAIRVKGVLLEHEDQYLRIIGEMCGRPCDKYIIGCTNPLKDKSN